MTERHQLIAYLATLTALVAVFSAALFASGHGVNVTEAFGVGTITGGLIGVLRIPSVRPTASTEAQDEALKVLADKVPPQTGEAAG